MGHLQLLGPAAPAAVLAVLLARQRRVSRSERAAHQQRGLVLRFTDAVAASVDTDDALATVVRQATEALRAGGAELLLPAGTGTAGHWVRYDVQGGLRSPGRFPPSDAAALGLARTGATVVHGPVVGLPAGSHALVVPLAAGALVVHGRPFDGADVALAGCLAAAAATGLAKARLFDEVRHAAQQREHQALHDPLTGMPNRALLTTRVQAVLEGRPVGVLLLDVDRFHDLNDTLGHDVGDQLLRLVGDRLVDSYFGSGAVLSRLSGDEFAIALPDLRQDDLAAAVTRLLAVFDEPFPVAGTKVHLAVTVGAASSVNAPGADRLLQYAEISMYDAKRRGTHVGVHRGGGHAARRRRLALVAELRQAVELGELGVAYQPKVDLMTGRPCGVEALVRWTSREHGPVGPDEFVPLAEQSGLVAALTRHVLDRALTLAARWQADGRQLTVAVNVSPRGLADGSLLADVPAELTRRGVHPGGLVLELTEGTVMRDPALSLQVLQVLSGLGVGLSIDDFGTGYSSLAYLKRLPVDEVKIDRSFVMGLGRDGDDAAIVRSTVRLAHDLGLRVVAEGVEDAVAYAALRGMGCDQAQGYLLSKPLAEAELETWLDGWQGHPVTLLAPVAPAPAPPAAPDAAVRRTARQPG